MKIEHEIIKWLLDISKYVITAVIISSFLMGLRETWQIYVFGGLISVAIFSAAVFASKYLKKREQNT